MFFDSWHDLLQVVVVGCLTYVVLIVLLRLSGKRTLSKWNAFDFVVTIAFGSTLASTLLSQDVSMLEGCAALAMLVGLQFVVTWASVRWAWVRRLVKAEPVLLLYQGRFNEDVMRQERVPESEVRAALRAAGVSSVEQASAVVLETDGNFSVLADLGNPASALKDVRGFEEAATRYGANTADRTPAASSQRSSR